MASTQIARRGGAHDALLDRLRVEQMMDQFRTLPDQNWRRRARDVGQWLDHSELAKDVGGGLAMLAGDAVGFGRGGVHAVQGLIEAPKVVAGLGNPYDDTTRRRFAAAGKAALAYGRDRFDHPDRIVGDIGNQLHRANVALNPAASPRAETFAGELARNFGIGMNQGELGFDIATIPLGGAGAKAASKLGAVARMAGLAEKAGPAKYIKQGFTPAQAARLAESNVGMGDHAYFARRFRVPEKLGPIPLPKQIARKPLPKAILDSEYNVRKFDEEKGQAYRRHYQEDPRAGGFRIGGSDGGWSPKKLGLKKYGALRRALVRHPPAMQRLVGRTAAAGAASHGLFGDLSSYDEAGQLSGWNDR